jgi:LysR family transcriptional regulator, carnitine catabolism transcriptional activator
MIDFTSRQLRAFLLVAQHSSFARAAEALFITPSGLSLLVRELETQVGFRLFDRTTRRVALTARGEELLAVARRNIHEFDATVSRLGQTARTAGQTIWLGAPPLVASNILPRAIKEFHTHRPDLRVRLFDADLATIRRHVEAGKLDVALGVFGKGPDIRRTPFFRFSFVVIRPDNESAVRRAATTWSALRGETLVSLSATSVVQQLVDQHLAHAGIETRSSIVLNSLETQIAMVEAEHGVAVIPSFGVPACQNRRVVVSRLINPVVTLDFHQISSRARATPPGTGDLTTFLQGYIARWAGSAGIL